MPTYEYKCDSCGYLFEEFQSISDKPIEKCPKCNSKVRRLIGGGNGFIFKGSGFYITDYRNKSYSEAAKADKPSDKKVDKKADSTSAKVDSNKRKDTKSSEK